MNEGKYGPEKLRIRTLFTQWKPHYNAWTIEVDQGIFTTFVFATAGGMGSGCTVLFKLASLISIKRGIDKSKVTPWIKTKANFALRRSIL